MREALAARSSQAVEFADEGLLACADLIPSCWRAGGSGPHWRCGSLKRALALLKRYGNALRAWQTGDPAQRLALGCSKDILRAPWRCCRRSILGHRDRVALG